MELRTLGSHSSALFLYVLQGSAGCSFILPSTKLTRGGRDRFCCPSLSPHCSCSGSFGGGPFCSGVSSAAQGFLGAFWSCVLAVPRQRWRLGAEEEEQEEMWLGRGWLLLCHWDQLHFVS